MADHYQTIHVNLPPVLHWETKIAASVLGIAMATFGTRAIKEKLDRMDLDFAELSKLKHEPPPPDGDTGDGKRKGYY